MQRSFASSTAVAILLVFGAKTSSAQGFVAASAPASHAETRQELREVSSVQSVDSVEDASTSTFNAPLPPPPPPLPPLPRQLTRKKATVLGIVIGGALGATAGYFLAHDSCDSCDDSGRMVLASSFGAVAGAALGGFVAMQNSPADVARSSLRTGAARMTNLPIPLLRYHVTVF